MAHPQLKLRDSRRCLPVALALCVVTVHGFGNPSNRIIGRRRKLQVDSRHDLSRRRMVMYEPAEILTPGTAEQMEVEEANDSNSYYVESLQEVKVHGLFPKDIVELAPEIDEEITASFTMEDVKLRLEEQQEQPSMMDGILSSYIGPRAILGVSALLYGSNFPLATMMTDTLPPSAITSGRMVLAGLLLAPSIPKLNPDLIKPALLCGVVTAIGYIFQSVALVDTSPATVSFLGQATVLVCPVLQAVVNKKPMSPTDAPQTWLSALLCVLGVGVLELVDAGGHLNVDQVGMGDLLGLVAGCMYGAAIFLVEGMMEGRPEQALPITAVQISTTAFLSAIWCFFDGWVGTAEGASYGIPNVFLDPTIIPAALALAWSGVVITAGTRYVETEALGRVPSSEASVLLATEPLWAALVATLLLSETFGANDYIGGALIVSACLANTLDPAMLDVKQAMRRFGRVSVVLQRTVLKQVSNLLG